MSELKMWIVACLGTAALVSAHGAREDAVDFTVAAGSPETWTHVTNEVKTLYLHDNLTIGAGAVLKLYSKSPTNSKVLLPAADGEDVTLSFVDNAGFEDGGGSIYTDMYISENGGKGKFSVGGFSLGGPTRLWLRDTAEPDDDGFVNFLSIANGGKVRVGEWRFYNTSHPARIRLSGTSGFTSRTFLYDWFILSANTRLYLHGDDGAAITFWQNTWENNEYDKTLVNNQESSLLVTTGACDVVFADSDAHVGKRKMRLRYRASQYDWAHSGDTVVFGALTLCAEVPNVLPHGPRTGMIRLKSPNNKQPTLDLCGTTQTVNGVVGVATSSMVTNSSTTADGVLRLGTWNEDGEFSPGKVSARVRVFKEGSGTLTMGGSTMPHFDAKGGGLLVTKPVAAEAFSVSGAVVRLSADADLTCGTFAATNTTFIFNGGVFESKNAAFGDGISVTYPATAPSNVFVRATDTSGAPIVKEGPSYMTCETPADAHGRFLHVRGGTLRFGGSPCTNEYWRFIVKEAKNVNAYAMPDGSTITVTLAVGTIGLFSGGGLDLLGSVSAATTGSAISGLADNRVVSANRPFFWNNAEFTKTYGATYGVTDKNNPIGNGANYMSVAYAFQNANGAASNTYDTVDINSWWGGTLYTNHTLVANDPSTWETLGWRVPSNSKPACSYSLANATNLGGNMQPKSWELQSSADGVTWETMDERTGQSSKDAPRRFMYNNHIPYLFSAKSNDWHFATFGTIRVDAGAVLDLSEIPHANIAVNALAVDLTSGAGTIKRFVPAAAGTIDLLNPTSSMLSGGKLKTRITLPITLTDVSGEANLASWRVNVNGVPSRASSLTWRDGNIVVETMNGIVIMVR